MADTADQPDDTGCGGDVMLAVRKHVIRFSNHNELDHVVYCGQGAELLEMQGYTADIIYSPQRFGGVSALIHVDVRYVFVYCIRCQ